MTPEISRERLSSPKVFDTLQDKLQVALSDVRSRGKLTESDVDKAMRQVRLALLEADVNLRVVKEFTASVKGRCLGAEVLESLNPGQQVVKIVSEELTRLMGSSSSDLVTSPKPPTVVLIAGLQGSGKTTACGKLARSLKDRGGQVALAACDLQRPAAVEQLQAVGARAGVVVYQQGTEREAIDVAEWALGRARQEGKDYLIVDTAGRLHIDADLMDELAKIKGRIRPHNVLLVLDAMTGQDAVNVAERFLSGVDFDGVVMTKLDGDARGGAALSIKRVTDRPIKFVSTGESLDSFELFHPDRMASRILGMGDMLTLIEKAEKEVDHKRAQELERKIRKQTFTLDDFLQQMRQVRRMGPIGNLLGMVPGLAGIKELRGLQVDERELDRLQAIITSMTVEERAKPSIVNGSRRRRIAVGSGTSVQAVNQLVKQFDQMQKLMRQMQQGKMPALGQIVQRR